jgi:glycosyltransferase involved in cell wall biosynthesis
VNPCLLIPIYNHGDTIGAVLDGLAYLDLPCIIVDDGSDESTQEALRKAETRHAFVQLLRRSHNGGKGAALKEGYRHAAALGYSHALQLDADGQHSSSDIPRFLAAAKKAPKALVMATSLLINAPPSRRYGRLLTYFWVSIETLSRELGDPLCGLRCLPLAAVIELLERTKCGDHMDFDPEIVVRLLWQGVPVVRVETRVEYNEDGVSHFNFWRDNLLITWLHTRLFFGMLARAPRLLARRFRSRR